MSNHLHTRQLSDNYLTDINTLKLPGKGHGIIPYPSSKQRRQLN